MKLLLSLNTSTPRTLANTSLKVIKIINNFQSLIKKCTYKWFPKANINSLFPLNF